jgi:hypothetical protein
MVARRREDTTMIAERKKPTTKKQLIDALGRMSIQSIDTYDIEIDSDRRSLQSRISEITRAGTGVSVIVIKN